MEVIKDLTAEQAMGQIMGLAKTIAQREHPNALTTQEWEQLKTLVLGFSFPTSLGTAPYGFSFTVHEIGEIHGERTPVLLFLEDHQFPFPSAKTGFRGQMKTLQVISEITHTPRNAEVLEWHGFDPLQENLSYYTY